MLARQCSIRHLRAAALIDICTTPWFSVFQALFTRGGNSPELELFLANRPGEHGLKQAARSIDASLSSAHNATCVALTDALHRVAFLLGELGGLVLSSPAYVGLGVQVRVVLHVDFLCAACLSRTGVVPSTSMQPIWPELNL